jgi:hypothetical protein
MWLHKSGGEPVSTRRWGCKVETTPSRDCIAHQRAYAYNEHFNTSVNMAMSMFKLSITPRCALIAARVWARLILDRRYDLINDRPNRGTAAEAPLDGAQERYRFDYPTTHTRGAYQHGEAP